MFFRLNFFLRGRCFPFFSGRCAGLAFLNRLTAFLQCSNLLTVPHGAIAVGFEFLLRFFLSAGDLRPEVVIPVGEQCLIFRLKFLEVGFQFGDFRIQLPKGRRFHGFIELVLRRSGKIQFPGDRVDPKPEVAVGSVQRIDDGLRFLLFRGGQLFLFRQLFEPLQLSKMRFLLRIISGLNDLRGCGKLPLCFRQGNDASLCHIHGKSEIAVFCSELFQQGVCLRNSGRVQPRHFGKFLQAADLFRVLRSGDFEGKVPEIRRNAVESDDLSRCPVDRNSEIAIFLRQFSDQAFRVVLLIHIQCDFQ